MSRLLCALLVGTAYLLIGCGDAGPVKKEPESDFVPSGSWPSNDEGGPSGRGSAVIDPCLGPRCERPNWEGRDSIVDPLTDLNVVPLTPEVPSVEVSAPR